jgi:hypothetical protein
MAAGQGFKTFTTGEVLTAGDVNGYLMQGVLVFASAAARNAAITSPQEGQFAFTKDTNGLWYYDGAAWVASGATGDIEGVTAGVGITGGGTSGTVTITNDMATTITASGDIVVGTGSGTYDNLPIGTTGQLLTADTTVSPYKVKWASPAAASSGLTKITSATFTTVADTGTTFDGVFSSTYKNYVIVFSNIVGSAGNTDFNFQLRKSGPTTQASAYYGTRLTGATLTTISNGAAFKLFTLQTEAASGEMLLARNATPTSMTYTGFERYLNTSILAAAHNDNVGANAALGFILSPSSGTISGFVAVYGLAD